MGTPYKIQKIPRTPGCNNGLPVQGISRFYLMLVLGLTRSKLRAQRCRHNGLDGVHPVFGFLEHDGLRAGEHFIGHFHGIAAKLFAHLLANGGRGVGVGGQSVHEHGG